MNSFSIALCPDGAAVSRWRRLPAGADLTLLPELFDGGYQSLSEGKPPVLYRDPLLARLRHLTQVSGSILVAGTLYLHHATPAPTNTCLAFKKGKLLHRFDKIHLFKPTGDTRYFSSGTRPLRVFSAGAFKIGVIICYDLRFPELARVLARQQMDILLVPARWPASRDDAWQSLLKARAIENQVFVIGCNSSDSEGGYSYIFDPFGRCMFANRGKRNAASHIVKLDMRLLGQARNFHNNIAEALYLRKLLKGKAV